MVHGLVIVEVISDMDEIVKAKSVGGKPFVRITTLDHQPIADFSLNLAEQMMPVIEAHREREAARLRSTH